jgi:nucleoside phosphorylase
LAKARQGLLEAPPARGAVDAHQLLTIGQTVWRDVIARMQRDVAFANALAESLADDRGNSQQALAANLGPMDRASLYLTMLRVFTPETDPVRTGAGAVIQREQIARFRDGLLRTLAEAGEVEAVQWILEQEPQREALRWQLVAAKERRTDSAWVPLELDEFLRRAHVFAAVVVSALGNAPILIFQSPVANPLELATTLQGMINGLAVKAIADRIEVTGSEDAIQNLIALAEKNALGSTSNQFLGIRSGTGWLFETVPFVHPEEVIPTDILREDLSERLRSIDVLVMTATDCETNAVLAAMKPLPGEALLLSGTLSIDTYTLGTLGRYAVVHCQSGMGSTAADGAQFTTGDAIREVAPKVILLVGIAFGMKRTEQRLGDVLVAKNIRPYEMFKLQPNTLGDRGSSIPASVKLAKWFKERSRDWRFRRADGSHVQLMTPGDVLSGEKLVNNRDFRDWLLHIFPSALGGEMEGIGAYAANQRYGPCEIVLVKAICDWADGCKNDRAQPFAAAAAVSAVAHVLSKQDILLPLGIAAAL